MPAPEHPRLGCDACAACTQPSAAHAGPAQTRRVWLGGLFGAAIALLTPRRAAAKKLAIRLAHAPQLKRVGGFAIFRIHGREVLLIRDGERSVRALTAFCSHKKTRLGYSHQKGRIVCPNHGSWFTLEGKVRKGPAKKDLAPIYWAKLDSERQRILLRVP